MPSSPQQSDTFFSTYQPSTAVVGTARADFSAWLGTRHDAPELHDDMVVVVSELVANAVQASRGDSGTITVAAAMEDQSLTLEVTNPASSTLATVNRWDHGDPLRSGGRGLLIVESLVDDVVISPPDGTRALTVRCRRRLPAS